MTNEDSLPATDAEKLRNRAEPLGQGNAANIREDLETHAGGTVPAAYTGSGSGEKAVHPEDALDERTGWDERG
jgi:hypothetical protein